MRDMIEGATLVVLSFVALWGAWLVPAPAPGETWAGLVPFAASLALLGLSCLLVLNGFRMRTDGPSADAVAMGTGTPQILALFLVALIYQGSFQWFGYLLPTAIAAPVTLYMFGVRNLAGLAVSVVLCPLVFHIIFFELLGVFPPYGEVFDLLDVIRG